MEDSEPVIVTALSYERRALVRAGLEPRARLVCCGPGAEAVAAWARRDPIAAGCTVVLAGLAGALTGRHHPGTAHLAATVIDAHGRRWSPPLGGDAVLAAAPAVLTGPTQKRQWAQGASADLVDLESAAFATVATARGWRWGVIRGVSDGPDESLPEAIGDWVDARGRVRPAKVCAGLLRRPGDAGRLRQLARTSRKAMAAVAGRLETLLAENHG